MTKKDVTVRQICELSGEPWQGVTTALDRPASLYYSFFGRATRAAYDALPEGE